MIANEKIYKIDEWGNWLKTLGFAQPSDYKSRLLKLNREFISLLNTGEKGNTPFALLEKYMTASEKGPKKDLIRDFLTAISTRINQELKELRKSRNAKAANIFSSERSAFLKYKEFIDQLVDIKYRKENTTPKENGVIYNIAGQNIVLMQDELIAIFASRISTQDRISGAKTYLPLGLIGKLLKRGELRDWALDEAKKVRLHILSGYYTVENIDCLSIDTQTCVVEIEHDRCKETVFNPPINGSKSEMRISLISQTDIDHDPEIHTILKNNTGKLPGLDLLTKFIKAKQKALGISNISARNCNKIYNEVLKDTGMKNQATANLSQIMNDVNLVTGQHILQLASDQWNRSAKKNAKVRFLNSIDCFNKRIIRERDVLLDSVRDCIPLDDRYNEYDGKNANFFIYQDKGIAGLLSIEYEEEAIAKMLLDDIDEINLPAHIKNLRLSVVIPYEGDDCEISHSIQFLGDFIFVKKGNEWSFKKRIKQHKL